VPRVPDDAPPLPPAEALRAAQELIDGDRPFHAHEVLEGAWKAADGPEREFWRALAQLAVGLAHLQRGNAKGAVALLRRGAAGLAAYAAEPPYAVPVADVVAQAEALAEAVADGAATPEPGAIRLLGG
jgi:hypothetical protein